MLKTIFCVHFTFYAILLEHSSAIQVLDFIPSSQNLEAINKDLKENYGVSIKLIVNIVKFLEAMDKVGDAVGKVGDAVGKVGDTVGKVGDKADDAKDKVIGKADDAKEKVEGAAKILKKPFGP